METLIRAVVFVNTVVVDLHSIVRTVLNLALISSRDDEVVFDHGSKIMLGRHRRNLMLLCIPLEGGFFCLCA